MRHSALAELGGRQTCAAGYPTWNRDQSVFTFSLFTQLFYFNSSTMAESPKLISSEVLFHMRNFTIRNFCIMNHYHWRRGGGGIGGGRWELTPTFPLSQVVPSSPVHERQKAPGVGELEIISTSLVSSCLYKLISASRASVNSYHHSNPDSSPLFVSFVCLYFTAEFVRAL